MITHGKSRAPVREAVLHCAAIKSGQFKGQTALEIYATVNRWHRQRGFRNGFGYHGLFMPSGSFVSGRPYTAIGAHVAGRNTGTLGFLLIESREITRIGDFSDWFTEAQRVALKRHLAAIDGLITVTGHNDHANKLCPGFRVKTSDWL